jgi:hypothetical protein
MRRLKQEKKDALSFEENLANVSIQTQMHRQDS